MATNAKGRRLRDVCAIALTTAGVTLGGCAMPNSSNPTLRITDLSVSDGTASVRVAIENESDYDLLLRSIDWTLVHGPMPVASGVWEVNEPLTSGSRVELSRQIKFDSPSLDPDSSEIELSGQLNFGDGAGVEHAAFDAAGKSGR